MGVVIIDDNIEENIHVTAIEVLDIDAMINNMGAEIEGRNLETEKHNTGVELEYKKSNIDLQIGSLQRDIEIKNVDIDSMRKKFFC